MNIKEVLNKRICDVVEGASNTQTFREFIRESEDEFEIAPANLDSMSEEELSNYGEPDYTILCAPGFKCDPEVDGVNSEACIAIDYEAHTIIICGSRYAGEIKKSVFATMNYIMTKKNVLPMPLQVEMPFLWAY